MSGETTQQRSGSGSGSVGNGPHLVLPQPVSDKGIMESVTGFINDVVPQVSSGGNCNDSKDSITWTRFEEAEDGQDLLLVLGYGNGVQIWSVNSNGEAREALSWRRGVVRVLRVLLNPEQDVHDAFAHKRSIVAICDSSGPGQQFCSLTFVSLRVGDQVKIFKYKNPVSDVFCSRRVIVVSFAEKLAILDAGTMEERKAVVTCYPVSGPNPNPIALGARWLAYADKKLSSNNLSAGGVDSFCSQSVTATVLHAAKSLGKAVASSLTGQKTGGTAENMNPGIVTILDVNAARSHEEADDRVAHFVAHNEAIAAISFDPSGLLLLTADKHGHDFHVFRIHPHACGSSGAAIHHLYVLHRGDTVAKVQDVTWTSDSRWVAISTLRGTTHVFALTTYGGPVSVRTHLSSHVVNRHSRFHRSAGLLADGRNSPETIALAPYCASPNPRLPPFPHATVILVLGQIRQTQQPAYESHRPAARNSPTDDAAMIPVKLSAKFASPRGWLSSGTKPSYKNEKRLVDSLFIMSCSGILVEYHLKPRPSSNIPREKVCDDTALELEAEAKAQWNLLLPPHTMELQLPLSPTNPLMPVLGPPESLILDEDEHWLSQVEIVTHAGPHRRLWMGPQFSFKTFSAKEPEPVDVGQGPRSNPVNIPLGSSSQPVVPVLIEAAPCSSLEQSPRLHAGSSDSDSSGPGDSQLAESLADAMMENPNVNQVNSDFISL